MNPLIQGKSGTTPVMSRNAFSTNQGTNEDDSQSDPHPEAGIFGNQTMRNSGQKDRRDMVTGGSEEIRNGQKDRRDMARGVQRESLCQGDLVTGVHEEVTYCSLSISSGKQKKNRPTSQPQFRSERPLRRSKQTKFRWPSNSWQITTILRTFTITSTELANCQTH